MDNLSRRLLQASCAVALTAAIASPAQAQSTRKDLKTGNKFFEQENYRAALPYYEKVLAKDPNNAKALFNAGISYMSFDKEKASDYIYKAQKLKPKVSKDVEYWLGRVDHLNYNFDEAVAHFQAYNATLKKNDQRKEELAQLIQHSKNAKVQFNSPKDIFVKNLGPTINTQFSEHSPVISSDNKMLIFTSRGENVTGATGSVSDKKNKSVAADGEYYEDIFEATRVDDENWQKPRSLSGVLNGKGHDASIQLFDNDTKMLMYRNDNNGDIFVTDKSGGDWTAPKSLDGNINSKAFESDAFITPDGLTIYFSTGKYSEDGTLDLYTSTRTSTGSDWGTARSLGANINTKYDDDSPYLSKDGKTLYFSSRGHNTMGGYDIFKSDYDEAGRKWGPAQNMGYPVNTPDDDSYYRLSPDGSYAYLSSYRIGGYGEKDIYTINYIKNANIVGKVFSSKDSTTVIPGVELVFSGSQADKTALSFRDVTKPDGAYQVAVLSGRTYQVAVSKDGKPIETQEFAVPVSTNDSTTITKNFYINYVDTTATGLFATKNIYFDTDKYKLRPESITTLKEISQVLTANPGINISVEGHCDSRNTDEYNMVLGQNRANAAFNYLKKQGIAEARMTTVSYGERRPAAPNDSPENMQLNRRDEFKVVLKEGETMPTMTAPTSATGTGMSGSTTTTTTTAVPLSPGKSKVKLADGTKVKTKVDEDSDKVKVKTKGSAGEKSKTVTKNGELDAKAKDANGEKTKVKAKN
ncbi:OmpA family protein [Hymenobacter artigasi]|uniref:Outer membrane protein OmpA-like peptidoglycan-associated protein/predicted DNA-binding antitoxin AbrB/MazE fold protein n=1 Tax=Hymenobacter artigasi TaxID=2719616 RepID=A0ABX1HK77_9BACT|nr:OmpA family protein [Hymenobacter artigasi]NKI90679.1 outer membrane protein OmpA-like peptidoglycan-associated protein/predicted DNA-binding antitoxin AbrB/MazE fold protein [Hymenobacter artigasi]